MLGVNVASRPDWQKDRNTSADWFHDPFVMFGFLAGVTKLGFSTGVLILAQRQTVLVAKQAASLDVLCDGRFRLGVGVGWNEVEFTGLGADARRRGAAMEEILQILPQAWTGDPFSHHGAVYDLPTLAVRPTPSTRIPILVGGSAEPAIRRAGRLADGVFLSSPVARFVEQVHWVLDECERIGRDPSTFRFIHYSVLLAGASRAEALARYRYAAWAVQWKYSDMAASATRPLPAVTPPPFDRPDETLVKGRAAYAGTPDELVEALLDIRAQAGVPLEFVARSHFPLLDYEAQVELMQQLAEGVAPHV